MPAYVVRIKPTAIKTLASYPSSLRTRLVEAIDGLAMNPRPDGVKKLRGPHAGEWRVAVGGYRIAYEVDDAALTVLVLAVGPRGDFY